VQTAYSAAREVLDRADSAAPRGDAFFELAVRRLASGETALASKLDSMDDGYGSVVGVVRDLLDAGFQPGHEDGVLERLDDLERPVAGRRLERARAVVRVAARSYEVMEASGSWRSAHVFEHARSLLYEVGRPALPASSIMVHGFADVTGLVADFLEALALVAPLTVLIDRPQRPGRTGREEPGLAFLDRIEARFSGFERLDGSGPVQPPEVLLSEAPDVESEVRWVAERVRALLDIGCAAEDIGIVARVLEGLTSPIRRHFGRLGVPFSGAGESVAGGGLRYEVQRLAELLKLGAAAPVDLWMEGRGPAEHGAELLLGLRQTGTLRIEDLAVLDVERTFNNGVRLPVDLRTGALEERPSPPRLAASALKQARAQASEIAKVFAEWPESAGAEVHAGVTIEAIAALGWGRDELRWREVVPRLRQLAVELSGLPDIRRREWQRLSAEVLTGVGDVPVGGRGGGVQVLSVTEARARTFEHLFVIGLNRGVFPRVVGDDSMLPDIIRARLALDVLPEMPVRARSADEERYLFAQLLSAAPNLHVSWHLASREGVRTRSSFVADLLGPEAPDSVAPVVWSTCRSDFGPRPAFEHAVLAAAGGRREDLSSILAVAFSEGLSSDQASSAAELARVRVAILDEVDPRLPVSGPSPWFGFVGGACRVDRKGLSVTGVEAVAECPWSSFVTRRLGVAPMPDPHLGLPDPKGLLVGNVVHRVLELIVRGGLRDAPAEVVEELAGRDPEPIRWPDSNAFESILTEVARQVAAEAGMAQLGMAVLLAARSRPYLEVARRTEWGDEGVLTTVLAPEVSGTAEIPGVDEAIRFRADRVDRRPDGVTCVDYKTGKPVSSAKKEDTRRRHLMKKIATGRMLQAAAYASAKNLGPASGRYLWLKPDIKETPEAARSALITCDDRDAALYLASAVTAVVRASDEGAMFPRVEEVGSDKLPDHCRYCAVVEVCRRDDSGFRRRLVDWMEAGGDTARPVDSAARTLWHLGATLEEEP
jgi:RecB family exonuclease